MSTYLGSKKMTSKVLMLLLLFSLADNKSAAQDDLLDETADILNSEQIDIDGQFERETQADKLAKMRKKLEKQNENMVQKKIEDIRVREEQKLTTKLQNAFNGNSIVNDSVAVQQSAPMKSTQKVEEKKNTDIKISPSFGLTSMMGEGLELESKITAGLSIETMVSKRFSVGLGINYTSVEMTDIASDNYTYNSFYNYWSPYTSNYNYNSLYNSFYNQNYYNSYGTSGRTMEYTNFGLDLNTKFFIIVEKRLRPYIGLGVSYNRASVNYLENNNSSYQWQGNSLGDEGYTTSFMGASASVGTEVVFTDNVGLNLDVKYSRALTSGFDNSTEFTFNYNPEQERLEKVSNAINGSDIFVMSAGMMFSF
ncbi:MAG: hypothetical protein HOJ35_00275 [Bdellovibrionales bacterium]|nr:hypothetical protein [Bdellovibrionales bacterium]